MLFCSTRTGGRRKRRFERSGVPAVLGERRGRRSPFGTWLIHLVAGWGTQRSPRDFGFLRSRWCCGVVVVLLAEVSHVRVSPETVRRWLQRENLVWRRPRPVLGPTDPQRAAKLRDLRELLQNLPADEIAVFQDEVDVNLDPKIGSMWMRRGEQAEVPTPGTNEKRYLAGSLNWQTGDVVLTEGLPRAGRNSALFLRHPDDVRYDSRCYRKIHVICDHAIFHACRAAQAHLRVRGYRIKLHDPPTSCRRPTRSNACGGICTRKSPATTGAGPSTSCST